MIGSPPLSVLSRYAPALDGLTWVPVSGGFSGASVWRGEAHGVPLFALKAWPTQTTPDHLAQIHTWMAQAASLPFVPTILHTATRQTVVSEGGRVWDVTRWMPGEARESPNIAEVETACVAVARLHRAWPVERVGPCPGVLNRLRIFEDFRARFGSSLPDRSRIPGAFLPLTERARSLVTAIIPQVEQALRLWESVSLPLQPCVRDLRAEHVLFSQGNVTGIVDYGAMAVDHPAVDLARFLGEILADESGMTAGLGAYEREGNTDLPAGFVQLLAKSGLVGSAIGWLVRIFTQPQENSEVQAITARFGKLLNGLERFAPE